MVSVRQMQNVYNEKGNKNTMQKKLHFWGLIITLKKR